MNGSGRRRAAIQSPCINLCVVDADSGLCSGCYRTLDEIAKWSSYTAAERQKIMDDELPIRSAQIRRPRG